MIAFDPSYVPGDLVKVVVRSSDWIGLYPSNDGAGSSQPLDHLNGGTMLFIVAVLDCARVAAGRPSDCRVFVVVPKTGRTGWVYTSNIYKA